MGFEVLPAIDISGGRLAFYTPKGPAASKAFGGDPIAAARAHIAAGARWLHVVDMDLAFDGEARNLDLVRAIASLGLPVQASGGVRTSDDVQAMLDAGAHRVVLGSGALADEASTLDSMRRFSDRLVVGIEIDEGRIRSRGAKRIDLPLAQTLGWLVAGGAHTFLATTVPRVGSLAGPDVATVKRVIRAGKPVLAAGGIASIDDLRVLRRAGAMGAVVGRAALDGGLDLATALELSR